MPWLLSATQAIFFSSAYSTADHLPSRTKRDCQRITQGVRKSSIRKKKIISYRWEQIWFNSEMFPSRARLSFNSMKQHVPLVISTPMEGSDRTHQSSSSFLVLGHVSFRFNSWGRGTKPVEFLQLPKIAQTVTFSDIPNSNLLLPQSTEQT